MAAIESFICTQGASIPIVGILKDADGAAILDTYDGSEILGTTIWPTSNRAAVFSAATAWIDPAAASFLITITAAATVLLYPGVYEGMTRLTDAGDPADGFWFTVIIAEAPGGPPADPTATTITRLVVETELVDRDSALLLLCGKSTMADGKNRFMTGPLGFSLQCLGVTPTVPGMVTDDDLAKVPNSQFFVLCELATYQLTKNLLNNFAQPDQTTGNTKIHLNSMTERFRQQLVDLERQYGTYLNRNRVTLSPGAIRVQPRSRCSTWGWGEGSDS